MYFRDWKRDILTIPNLLSLLRLGLIPVYVCLYLKAKEPLQFYTAGAVLAISCLTDALDGIIARHFNMVSTLGIILDPLADKFTQFALMVCLCTRYPSLKPVLALFIIKELFQTLLGIIYLTRGQMLPGALITGKLCTTILFVSLLILVLVPSADTTVVKTIAAADCLFLTVSLVSYLFAYWGRHPGIRQLKQE